MGSARPPHRSQRAELPHWAPTLGIWRKSAVQAKDARRERWEATIDYFGHSLPVDSGSLTSSPQGLVPSWRSVFGTMRVLTFPGRRLVAMTLI